MKLRHAVAVAGLALSIQAQAADWISPGNLTNRVNASQDWEYRPLAIAGKKVVLGLDIILAPFRENREVCKSMLVTQKYMSQEQMVAGVTQPLKRQELLGEIYAKWLAQELAASGYFASVQYKTWKELAESSVRPALIITGSLLRTPGTELVVAGSFNRCFGKQWAPGTIQPIEIYLYTRESADLPSWSRQYRVARDTRLFKNTKMAVATASAMARIFSEVREDIYDAAQKLR